MKFALSDWVSSEPIDKINKRNDWLQQKKFSDEEQVSEDELFAPKPTELQSIGLETLDGYGMAIFSFPITGSNKRHYELWPKSHQETGKYRIVETKPKDLKIYEKVSKLDARKKLIYLHGIEKNIYGKKIEKILDYPKQVIVK